VAGSGQDGKGSPEIAPESGAAARERLLAVASKLSALFASGAVRVSESDGSLDNWQVFGPAMLARCNYLVESIAALANRHVDAAILTRCLYEHVVAFAWVAISPKDNLQRFLSREYSERRKSFNDLSQFQRDEQEGRGLESFREKYVREGVVEAPGVLDQAHAAAAAWNSVIDPSLRPGIGLRGQYPVIFRGFSDYVHPTMSSLAHFVVTRPDNSLGLGRPADEDIGAVEFASVLFGEMLLISSAVLGWPDRNAVLQAFEHHG
jgi:hypothetical protein